MAERLPPDRARRHAAVAALAAELGHDLQAPLNLFRLVTERLDCGEALDAEDVSLLREELDRLSAVSARLRTLARSASHETSCTALQVLRAALSLHPALVSEVAPQPQDLELDVDGSADFSVRGQPQLLGHALRELIDNALEAKLARAGVRFELAPTPSFCVWDDGPGFESGAERALHWGATTRVSASGLGLTVALRAARAHGFLLELRRAAPYSEARLTLVSQAALAPGGPP